MDLEIGDTAGQRIGIRLAQAPKVMDMAPGPYLDKTYRGQTTHVVTDDQDHTCANPGGSL